MSTETQSHLDAIGLARPAGFVDFAGAVSVLSESKSLRVMDRCDWQTSPREFMPVWDAERHMQAFRQAHAGAEIETRYILDDKSVIRIMAKYDDSRPDCRVTYQARNR